MSKIKLPLDELVLSIGFGSEEGPKPDAAQTPLFLDFSTLNEDRIRKIEPDRVLSWLICPDYDAYDVARLLSAAGFGGVFRAMADDLPNANVIEREIRNCFPDLNFELVCTSLLSERIAEYHNNVLDAGQGTGTRLQPA